ncbi:MAG: AarF/ABC1/UbiB kinase family protein [Cyclobacteriaceae bacterium]
METIDSIPTTKIQRASKILQTGAKVGVNYLKYYGDRISGQDDEAKENLNKSNAEDIYHGLKNLKGSALKVAQMLSMEKNILPKAYVEKFSLSQFSVPPLSPPLVIKTFVKYFGKSPDDIYDRFDAKSVNAASIGQVHQAWKDGKKLAVKIQYPGVSDSISTDLKLIKPIAIKMFNIQGKGSDQYFEEVENKLLDETDYKLEVDQSLEVAEACRVIPNIKFPTFYKNLSSERIISMDWMEGVHISEFANNNSDPDIANKLGQALWDFYMFQLHELRKFHADPHPGNFLISKQYKLIALDFGCIKSIPDTFYKPYFDLAKKKNLDDSDFFVSNLYKLEILRKDDNPQEIVFFTNMFRELLTLFTKPFQQEYFDFSNSEFFNKLGEMGEMYAKNSELRNMNGNRGSRHFIYVNRTFFGLYNLLHELKATKIKIHNYTNLR